MRQILVLMAGLFSMGMLFGQGEGKRGGGNPDMPANGIVTGQVLDQSGGEPMEYANVVLYNLRDSSIVAGTVTGSDGRFRIEKVRGGRLFAVANFIGYEKTYVHDIKVNPKSPLVEMGVIYLELASTNLEGVEVVADKAHLEYKIDKKIVNVSQDIFAQGSSAVAVLENTPSVQVDIEGNVSLRGTSNFEVLIDGRPSVLKGSEALQQIPASTINHIEIITNPSAKYDPDGIGGILNVVLKKQKTAGVNGVVNASIGTGNKYKVDGLMNYRSKHFNVFGGLDYNYRQFSMEGYSKNETYLEDTTSYRDSEREGEMTRNGYGIKAGIDYYLTDKSTLSFSGHYGVFGFGRDFLSTNASYTNPVTTEDYRMSDNESSRDGDYYNLNMNYMLKFDDKGQKLELLGYYANRKSDDWEEQKDYITDEDWNSIDDTPAYFRTSEDENSHEVRIKADYTKPMGEEGRLEAGYQSRLEYENEKYLFQDWDYVVSDWIDNDLYSNESDFKRNIHSIYGTYSNVWGSFGYQLGARGEYTDREIKNAQSPEPYIIDRFDFFPSIHLSKQFEGNNQVLASYSRRIDRPGGRELDPFVSYIDEYNKRVGNPALEPEYIDSYELGYQKRLENSFISLEAYYRVNNNKITRIRTLQDDGTFLHTYQNMNTDYSLGVELMLNADFTSWFNFNGSVNVFDYRLEGSVEDEDVTTSSTNWNGKMNFTFKNKNNFRAQLTGLYRGPTVTAQGSREGYFMVNAAIRKDFFDRKFSATLSARDIFSGARREMITEGDGFYTYDNFQREAPIISLNLSYIINNYKRRQNNGEGSDMNQGDMDMGM